MKNELSLARWTKTTIMKKWTLYFGLFLLSALSTLSAQKFGHLNVGNLLTSMPEANAADKQLEAYQAQLVSKGESMAKALQTDYEAFAAAVQRGEKTQLQIQEKEKALQAEQQKIAGYEQEVRQKLGKRREELLQPLLERVDAAIKEVGEENNFTFIFDSSAFNVVMFAEESADVAPLVKAKLGL